MRKMETEGAYMAALVCRMERKHICLKMKEV